MCSTDTKSCALSLCLLFYILPSLIFLYWSTSVFLHFLIIHLTFKALVFLFQYLAKDMYFKKVLMSLAKSFLLQFIVHNQAASSTQLHLFLVPGKFLVGTCFYPHCITQSRPLESDLSFEASLSHFSDFWKLCLLLSSPKIVALYPRSLFFLCMVLSTTIPTQDFLNLFSTGYYLSLMNFF